MAFVLSTFFSRVYPQYRSVLLSRKAFLNASIVKRSSKHKHVLNTSINLFMRRRRSICRSRRRRASIRPNSIVKKKKSKRRYSDFGLPRTQCNVCNWASAMPWRTICSTCACRTCRIRPRQGAQNPRCVVCTPPPRVIYPPPFPPKLSLYHDSTQ